jgi:sulfiredoxin
MTGSSTFADEHSKAETLEISWTTTSSATCLHHSVRQRYPSIMMKRETFAIADIYVPIKRRATLEQKRVDEIAASMLDTGQQTPILVRADGARFVLIEGLHRLEAAKALGEKTIVGYRVDARKH